MRGETRRALGRWLVWAIGVFAMYMVLADKPTPDELTTGAGVAAVAALAAVCLHRVAETTYAPRWDYIRHLVRVPGAIARDTFLVGGVLFRSLIDPETLKGEIEQYPFDFGEHKDPQEAVRRALVTFGISAAPATIVCAMDDGMFALHRLAGKPSPQLGNRRWPL